MPITFRRKQVLSKAELSREVPRDERLSESARAALEDGLAEAAHAWIRENHASTLAKLAKLAK